jgi:hypothetical protein
MMRVIVETEVATVAVSTVIVPKAAIKPEAAVFVTATAPTAVIHAVEHVIELLPVALEAASPALRVWK